MTQPVRIDPELLDSAKRAGATQGRSAAQQIAFWAQIGRQLESSTSLSVKAHRELAMAAYDELDPIAQAQERARWEREIAKRLAGLDLAEEFAAEGRPYVVVANDAGAPQRVDPGRHATRSRTKAAPKKKVRQTAKRG